MAVLGLGLAVAALGASPARAHASLRSSNPSDGEVLERPPSRVVLRFDEPMEVAFGDVRVYAGDGRRMDEGAPRHVGADRTAVGVGLPVDDATGWYVVTWRLPSADGHVTRGALSFRVGPAPAGRDEDLLRRLLSAQGGSAAAGALLVADRAVTFASLFVGAGGAAFFLLVWPAGVRDRRARRVVWAGVVGLGVSTVAALGLQAVVARGLGLGSVLRPSVYGDALGTRLGQLSAERLMLLGLFALTFARNRLRWLVPLGGVLLATVALAGHAGTGRWVPLAVLVDLVHLGAATLWLGGLVMLAVVVLRRGGAVDPRTVRVVAARFSPLAFGSVVALVASGVLQAWRQVGSPAALFGTTYGRLLILKMVLVAVVVALGAASRRWIARQRSSVPVGVGPGAAAADDLHDLRRSVGAEVVVSVAVVAIAGLLVSAVPARTDYGQPFATELRTAGGELLVDLTVDPSRAGPADIHIYTLAATGTLRDVSGLTAQLSLPSRDVGPLDVPLRRAGRGHFVAYGFTIPFPGNWQFAVSLDTGAGSPVPAVATVPVR